MWAWRLPPPWVRARSLAIFISSRSKRACGRIVQLGLARHQDQPVGDVDLGGADGACARLSGARLQPSLRGNQSPRPRQAGVCDQRARPVRWHLRGAPGRGDQSAGSFGTPRMISANGDGQTTAQHDPAEQRKSALIPRSSTGFVLPMTDTLPDIISPRSSLT
jgi:hypothetical protein